ncbi:MAG: helix-turn-helix domain-containing protein [Luteolibacter sp.]
MKLLGNIISASGDDRTKRRKLMAGLCEILNAQSWIWCMCELDPDKPPSFIGLEHGGWDEERFTRFIEAMNHPDMEYITRAASQEQQEKGIHLTRTRRQMDPDLLLEKSPALAFWERANVGSIITSQRPMQGGGISGIGLYRHLHLPQFTERDTRIAHIVLSEIPWLHFNAFPDQATRDITRLYPRHRTVLNLLCEGWPRKKIATYLKISENTVHGYTKEVFRHFSVHSQSELIARFTKGDGGDR